MPGLQRIILIDTHLPDVVELKLNGHTNICGTNASGKTTLQRLIPVFYGEYPSRVVPATRDSFERWYLPRQSSFIIYEFTRAEGDLCQAVLSSNGSGVQYRFIAKPFDLNDYTYKNNAGEHNIVSMTELARAMKRNDVLVSNLLNTKEFRAIIQNDRSTLNTSANSRELLGYAKVFSLCAQHANLRHIEKLTKAVHSKEGKMETIKAMIAAILEEDGVQPPRSSLSRQRVEDWIKESQLITEFDAIRPEFSKLEKSDLQLNDAEQRLADLNQQFSQDISLLSASSIELDGQLNDLIHQIKVNDKNWTQNRDELNQTVSSAKAEITTLSANLDQVEAEFDQWQQQDIEKLQQNVQQLPGWVNDLDSLNSRYLLLTEKHQDVESAFNKRVADLNEKLQGELDNYNNQLQQLQAQQSEQKQAEQDDLREIHQQYQNQREALSSDYAEQIQQLKIEQAELSTQLKNIGFNEFEQSQLDILEQSISEASAAEDSARGKLQQMQQQTQSAQQLRQQARQQLDDAARAEQQQQQLVDKTEALLYPGDATLLEFLRKQQPGWEQKLGKVIHPDLLKRQDLKPAMGEESDSLFGLTLDVSTLDTPEYAESEQLLQAKLAEQRAKLDVLAEQHSQAEQQLAKANEAVRVAELAQTRAESDCKTAEASRKRAQHDKEQSRQEYLSAVAERKQNSNKRLQANEKQQQKVAAQQQQALDELNERQLEAETERQFHWQQILGDISDKIAQVKDLLQSTRQHAELERKKCQDWLQDELNKRGLDVDEIGDIKKQIKQLKDDIQHTETHRHKVQDYQHWYKTVFTGHKVKWQNQLEKARKEFSDAERSLQKQQSEYQHQREADKARQTQLEHSLKTSREQHQAVESLHNSLNRIKLPLADKQSDLSQQQVAQRISEGQELLQQRESLLLDVRNYVDHFDKLIAKQAGTGLSDTWDRSREECTQMNAQGLRLLDHRKLVSHLNRLLNDIVPQKLAGLREQGRIFGADLSQYYHVLADIDKRIASQSQRISKEVDEELFLEGVSDSAVKIRSRISELEFWPELRQFQQLYEEWLQTGTQDLPKEDYSLSMRRVMEILGRAALSGGIINLLDIELHIKEGNSNLVIRTDRQLNESSSHGMAYLILCKFLLAFTRLLRGNAEVTMHWPIDELGTLHQSNVKKIFDACHNNNIHVLGAFPNPESDVLNLFANRYLIDKTTRRLQTVQPKVSAVSERLKQRQQEVSA
ncbi:ATP-binding protein [Neptunicella marina]|uniref:ATP-binding protein n=1 Tax=Neptunicella marina TaxID=2125989 RepID=A0A8J6ITF8_9ALTE|nr:ATP-binding protein [Neptunicella marina]MBC3765974.1 ATP-binding protein [Neptunicella marina]